MKRSTKKRLTCKRKRYLIKDERKASKEYKRYGYKRLSRQEASHRKFLKKQACH
jgi:hypothetical protein